MKRLAALALASCAPITTNTTVHDVDLRRATERVGKPSTEVAVDAKPGDDALAIRVVDHSTCVEQPVRYVKRTETVERSANKLVLTGEILLGLGAAGFGGYSLYDAAQASSAGTDPMLPTSTNTVGVISLVAAAPFLIAAIVDGVRAGDDVHVRGEVALPDTAHQTKVACGDAPKAGLALLLSLPDGSTIGLGTTDAEGKVTASYTRFAGTKLVAADWPHTLPLTDGTTKLADLDLTATRAALAEAAWKGAVQKNDRAAFEAYAKQFPEAHASDLAAHSKDAVAREYAAAIAANDPDAAKAALAAWRAAVPDDPQHAQRDAEVAALAAKVAQGHALATATKGIEALEAGTVVQPVPETEAALAQAAADPATAPQVDALRTRFVTARGKIVPVLVARAETQLRAGDYTGAETSYQQAQDLAPPELGLAKKRAAFDKRVEAGLTTSVAAAIRAGTFDRAHQLLDGGDKLLPGSAALAASRADLDRREKAIADKAAADKAARDKAAADKQAAADKAAADKAARDKAAADKAAADQAARDKAVADKQAAADKAAADKAAREQAAADKLAAQNAARDRAAADKQAAADKAAADKAAREQAAADKAAADKAAREQAAAAKLAAQNAARDKAAADKQAAADKAAADKAAREQAARDRAAAEQAKLATTRTAAGGTTAATTTGSATTTTGGTPPTQGIEAQQGTPTTEVKAGAFSSGYTDEEQCRPTGEETGDPYSARPPLGVAMGMGFGGGYKNGVAGLMVGEAGVRYRMARGFGSLSGGTGLQTLDLAVGADAALGYEAFHGLAVRGGYAHGWPVRAGNDWNELRADVGLNTVSGISWLGLRVRLDNSFGFDSFYLLVMLDRLR